jgi:hypothetical protein
MQAFSCYYGYMEKQIKTVTIRIAVDLLEDMRAIARQHDRSLNGEILTALPDHVARHKQKGTGKGYCAPSGKPQPPNR